MAEFIDEDRSTGRIHQQGRSGAPDEAKGLALLHSSPYGDALPFQ